MSRYKIYESGEMYLETILRLKKEMSEVHSVNIVDALQFSKSSVSRGVNILKDNGYITMDETGVIEFTPKGLEKANSIFERHRYLTEFLIKIGVEPTIAEEDACRMEHIVSDETFNVIKGYLKK